MKGPIKEIEQLLISIRDQIQRNNVDLANNEKFRPDLVQGLAHKHIRRVYRQLQLSEQTCIGTAFP